jgi:hypothetical protein
MLHHLQNNRDNMTKKLVSELEGAELDYFVALAIEHQAKINEFGCEVIDWNKVGTKVNGYRFNPSTDWTIGGEIIDNEGISLMYRPGKEGVCNSYYHAQVGPEEPENDTLMTDDDPLVAAMRSFVASKFGKYVDLPSHDDKELH